MNELTADDLIQLPVDEIRLPHIMDISWSAKPVRNSLSMHPLIRSAILSSLKKTDFAAVR